NPETAIEYELPEISEVTVKVYTLLGMEIKTLVNKIQNAGRYTLTWNGTDNGGRKVPSGIYFLRMQAGAFSQIRKMTFIQ
ncbi:MAG TPA: FlgD immunoglobulin-like domain containing protein, partial [bacterium]